MIRKLDRWAWAGGALLAFNGGLINAVGLSSAARQTISHVTGSTTLFSMAAARGDAGTALFLGSLVLVFACGAALGGLVVGNAPLQFGRRYAAALWAECSLLLASAVTITAHPQAGLALAAAACGLQNAMAGTYTGAAVRTTHMTGIITDLGAAAGGTLFAVVGYPALYGAVAITLGVAAACTLRTSRGS